MRTVEVVQAHEGLDLVGQERGAQGFAGADLRGDLDERPEGAVDALEVAERQAEHPEWLDRQDGEDGEEGRRQADHGFLAVAYPERLELFDRRVGHDG